MVLTLESATGMQTTWKKVKSNNKVHGYKWNNHMAMTNKPKRRIFDTEENMLVSINGNIFLYPPKAGVVIFNKTLTSVLLVSNNYSKDNVNAKYGLPKGHVEENETYATCAKRELYEETGLDIDINDESRFITVNNSKYFLFVLTNVDDKDFAPVDKREIGDCKFIKIDDFNNFDVNKETRVLLTKKKNLARKYAVQITL